MNEPYPHAVPIANKRNIFSYWLWLLPIIAVIVVIVLIITSLLGRGPLIVIQVPDAHGIKPGAEIEYLGMDIGVVEELQLVEQKRVLIHARLNADAAEIARTGTRFWIARPIVGLEGVSGINTILAGTHIAVQPGSGDPATFFDGLAEPPMRTGNLANSLELTLESSRRGGLVPGAPVLYRQIEVGRVVGVNLASDARNVQVRIVIVDTYARLVRPQSRFWMVRGLTVDAGLLSGVQLTVDSLSAVLRGGIEFATPEMSGEPVATGHRFALADKADPDWLNWSPSLAVGSSLPIGVRMPFVERVTLSWNGSGLFSRSHRQGVLAIPVADKLLLPRDVVASAYAADPKAILEIAGQRVELADNLPDNFNSESNEEEALTVVAIRLPAGVLANPAVRIRGAKKPEDVLVISSERTSYAIESGRFSVQGTSWFLGETSQLDKSWHGAPVVSRIDGTIIGMMFITASGASVVLLL